MGPLWALAVIMLELTNGGYCPYADLHHEAAWGAVTSAAGN
jgi:hypothetical protein